MRLCFTGHRQVAQVAVISPSCVLFSPLSFCFCFFIAVLTSVFKSLTAFTFMKAKANFLLI